jgi:hypothetical protein
MIGTFGSRMKDCQSYRDVLSERIGHEETMLSPKRN